MIYPGINSEFTRRFEPSQLAEVRELLALPLRYVVYSRAIYPPKNFRRLVQAYARVGPRLGVRSSSRAARTATYQAMRCRNRNDGVSEIGSTA
jgi:hypothetical protein